MPIDNLNATLTVKYAMRLILTTILCTSLIACSTVPHTTNQQLYNQGIADAAIASPQKMQKLLPIPADESVQVVSWVSASRVPCQPNSPPCALEVGADRLWVTLQGEVQQHCRAWNLQGPALTARLEQLLGLPPDSPAQYRKVKFVEMRIPRQKLDRPCLGVDASDPGHPTCTVTAKSANPASAELRNFVGQQMASSYLVGDSGNIGYPYTRLGYTYDWNPDAASNGHYGASEFIIAPGAVAEVGRLIDTDAYCASTQVN